MGSRTLCAVGWRAVKLKFLTRTLRKECRRSSAITVNCNNTSEREHKICHFITVKSSREWRLTTIIHNHNKCTIRFYTNKRTRCRIRGMVLSILILSVLYQEAEVCRNYLLLPTGNRVSSRTDKDLRHISRSCLAILFIKVNNYTGLSTGCLTLRVFINFTIKNQVSKRLAYKLRMLNVVCRIIPAKRNVHSSNYVAVAVCFCPFSLLRHNLNSI